MIVEKVSVYENMIILQKHSTSFEIEFLFIPLKLEARESNKYSKTKEQVIQIIEKHVFSS